MGSGQVWKWVGLAGLAGVATSGAVVARQRRTRQAFTPEQVRERLQERYAAAGRAAPADDGQADDGQADDEQGAPGARPRAGS